MDQEVLKFAISQGLFAALFVWLLIDTRKESKTREESLNKTNIFRDVLKARYQRITCL